MTVREIELGKEIIYQGSKKVIIGKIIGFPDWNNGQYRIPFKGRDGVVYVGTIDRIFTTEELRRL